MDVQKIFKPRSGRCAVLLQLGPPNDWCTLSIVAEPDLGCHCFQQTNKSAFMLPSSAHIDRAAASEIQTHSLCRAPIFEFASPAALMVGYMAMAPASNGGMHPVLFISLLLCLCRPRLRAPDGRCVQHSGQAPFQLCLPSVRRPVRVYGVCNLLDQHASVTHVIR